MVLATLARIEHVSNDRESDREQRTGTKTLDRAERDELPHRLREAREQRPDKEHGDREEKNGAATEEVRQLSVDRPADRRRKDVRRKCPRVDVVATKVGDDPRERGTDDGLIEGREEQSKEDSGDDLCSGPWIHASGRSCW